MTNLKQQNLPAEDLSDLGAPSARGAGLSGFLSPEPEEQASTPDSSAHLGAQREAVSVAAPPQPTRRPRRPGRPRTRAKPVSAVYVSPGVKKRFEDYRHNKRATNLQVVLEAISSMHEDLPEIIQAAAFSTAPVNPLFPADPSAIRYTGGGSVQIGFSATPEQEEVIDNIGDKLGFDTRSTWIAPVLNAFLPGRKDSARQSR